ncbi:hypothetical protein SPI_04283 [Niveomyces insectorum RCEF 264]|uniref:Uncharacterized protein n=1 Tax=Niveomyces insectorum RCEF 264 TaxID=1081102 RepID=A0A167VL23_9HYPO|nr:hypothetical protein SPI_04283 [Niveomyces insectorum RCEF 264]
MLFTLFISSMVFIFPQFRPCAGMATYLEEYRSKDYKPQVIETDMGRQIVAPDTPYVAGVYPNGLYFIDTRYDAETASYIKEQIEHAAIPKAGEYLFTDEILATAECRNATTHEPTFVFNPAYARVFFAQTMNRRNPDLKLPEHEPSGDWLVSYDIGLNNPLLQGANTCAEGPDCSSNDECKEYNAGCKTCSRGRIESDCEGSMLNGVSKCHKKKHCKKAVDTPREPGESDSAYYKRMDELHWG